MNILIMGPQGCGKGTQSKLLAEKYNLAVIEMGQLLREVATQDTDLGRQIFQLNKKKEMAPDAVVLKILKEQIEKIPLAQGVVFDGIPRNLAQVLVFEKELQELNRRVTKIIFIDLPRHESIRRISRRYHCENCQTPLILGEDIETSTAPCPACGGKIAQRVDDTLEGIEKRLDTFHAITMPVVEHYRQQGLVLEVAGILPPEQVHAMIISELEK